MSDDVLKFAGEEPAPQGSGIIPFDSSPHVWLHHKRLRADVGTGVFDKMSRAMNEGMDLVQVLSMESDGAWVRFIERKDMTGWKVYVPREQIISIVWKDEAWPTD